MDSEIDIEADTEAVGNGEGPTEAPNGASRQGAMAPALDCRSCGNPIAGPFCSFCGQKDDDLRRSSFVLLSEFMRDTFGFDSRMWRTLGLLAIAPGAVPNNYAHGKRSRFTPPVRLFLVVSFIFFLTLSMTQTLFVAFDLSFEKAPPGAFEILGDNDDKRITAERIEHETDDVSENGAAISEGADDSDDGGFSVRTNAENCPTAGSLEFFVRAADLTPIDRDIGDCLTFETEEGLSVEQVQARDTLTRVSKGVVFALEKPVAFNNAFNTWLPRVMLIMTPVLALILALFIRGRDALIYDHLVLSLYSHAAGFAIVAIAVVLTQLGAPFTGPAAASAMLIYFVVALRRAYHRGWIKTLWTTAMAGFIYTTILLSAVMYIVSQIIWRAAA